jgi:hypothetical protein
MRNIRLRLGYFFRVLKALSSQSQLKPEDFDWARRAWRNVWLRRYSH